MAKKTTRKADAEIVDEADMPTGSNVQIIDSSQLQLSDSITMQDLADVVVSESEENLLMERDTLTGNLNGHKRNHADLTAKLTTQAQELMDSVKVGKDAEALAKSMTDFSGTEYAAVVVRGECVVANRNVSATIKVARKKDVEECKSSYYSSIAERTIRKEFTVKMDRTIEEIAEQVREMQQIERDLLEVRKRIADLPRMARRAKSEIVKARMRGDIKTGHDILKTVMGVETRAISFNGGE